MAKDIRTCFIVGPIGKSGSDEHQRADKVLRHVFEPVCKECDLSIRRPDVPPDLSSVRM